MKPIKTLGVGFNVADESDSIESIDSAKCDKWGDCQPCYYPQSMYVTALQVHFGAPPVD